METRKTDWQPFIPIPKACIDDKRLGNAHLLVLFSLYSFMNSKTRSCFPSMSAISERARLSQNYTRKRIKDLIKFGYVRLMKMGGGRSANTYLLVDKKPLALSATTNNQFPPEVKLSDSPDLVNSGRGNNKNIKIKKDKYLSQEKKDDLKILEICNEFREKRFGIDPLEENENNLKHIILALRNYTYDEVLLVAKHYFDKADCEFMNTFNAFNLSKMPNKLQRAKDFSSRNPLKGDYKDIPLDKLIEGIGNEK